MGILSFNVILLVAALRFRLFDRKLSSSTGLLATVLAALGAIAYLSVFRFAGTNPALLVFGTLTVTIILLAAGRLVVGTIMARRDQLVRLATLGKMSAQMGHDLKNPLAALKGATQFLREERAQGRSIDDRTEFLDLLVEQIDRLQSAVEKYQRLGRIEAMRTPVQLNELVRSLVTLQKLGGSEEIAVRAELASDLPECPVDRDLVAGALENLLQNAFEATPRASQITVRTALTQTCHAQGVVLSVEDAGVGMSARTRERALDDFYTTKATRQRPRSGVRAPGGRGARRRGVADEQGRRRDHRAPVSPPGVAMSTTTIGPSANVLVVDDDPAVGMVLEAQLAQAGIACQHVPDARRALEVLRERPVDVVITDLRMPGASGVELLEDDRREAGRRSRSSC